MNSPENKTDDPDTPYHTPYRDARQFESPNDDPNRSGSSITTDKQQEQLATIPSTPSMLVVLDDAANFTEQVKQKSRQRRQQEDSAMAALKVQTKRLEAALAAEVKRRVDAIQQFQAHAQEEIHRVEDRLQQQIHQDREATLERLNLLEERLALLECKWQSDVSSVQHESTRTANRLQEQVTELKQQTQAERQARLEREAALQQQMTQLTNDYKELWQVERKERFTAIQQLTEQSSAEDLQRVESERTLDYKIGQELQALEEEIKAEQRDREQADQHIIDGLNHYMEEIQKSVAYISGI